MGDTIHVDSVVDAGSDFWFTIPVAMHELRPSMALPRHSFVPSSAVAAVAQGLHSVSESDFLSVDFTFSGSSLLRASASHTPLNTPNATTPAATGRSSPVVDSDEQLNEDGQHHHHELHEERRLILIVDDNEINLRLCARMLERSLDPARFTITTATSGAQALRLCAGKDFDIVFLDIIMPEMHGGECW